MKVFTKSGAMLELKEPPLGKGGEGAVYTIAGHPDKVAKIYVSDAESRRGKIEAMSTARGVVSKNPALANVAWPLAPLYDAKGSFLGFGMRRLDSDCKFDLLYEYPVPKGSALPLREKVELLEDMVTVVDALHSLGQVIGDFNNNNLNKVTGALKVGLMDVDSLHASIGWRTYPCEVCAPGYMAPELIRNVRGTTFKDCKLPTFTTETDDFSLAVHVFRMLMNGLHPYHVVKTPAPDGSLPAPVPLDKRVERGETPFFTHVAGAKLPLFAPSADAFPPYLLDAFRRAFVDGQGDPKSRPTASEWRHVLAAYKSELVQCDDDDMHWYWKEAPRCPYCEADLKTLSVINSPVAALAGARLRNTANAAAKAPSGGAASVTPGGPGARPMSLLMPPIWFWAVSMALSSFVFLAACVAAPICSSACVAIFGVYPVWMQAVFLLAALAGTAWYNRNCVKDARWTSLAKASLMSLVGIAVAIAAMAVIYTVAQILITIASLLFMTAAVIAVVAAFVEAF